MDQRTPLGIVKASIPGPWDIRRTQLRRPLSEGGQWRILVVVSDGQHRVTLQGRGTTKEEAWDDLLDRSLPDFLNKYNELPF